MQESCCEQRVQHHQRCDPHPVRRPGAVAFDRERQPLQVMLRSSPGPETGCSFDFAARITPDLIVAILTRSGDRVQNPFAAARPWWAPVAILTRSGDRVQVSRCAYFRPQEPLRSSPGPETGCSQKPRTKGASSLLLRSSPGPETGCSPVTSIVVVSTAAGVAILTRSGDRVQLLAPYTPSGSPGSLRSSPGPETGCSAASGAVRRSMRCCDPHPVRRPGAGRG